MNLKVLFLFLMYYGFISSMFLLPGSVLGQEGYINNISLNESTLQDEEIDTGGLFSSGVSFTRFLVFIGFGVGLPDDTPSFFSVMFILWESIITVLFIGFIFSSIWNG